MMTPYTFAVVALRLIGTTVVTLGLGLLLVAGIAWYRFGDPSNGLNSADMHLHDTYYVVSSVRYELFAPGCSCVAVGLTLLILSCPLGRVISRGLD